MVPFGEAYQLPIDMSNAVWSLPSSHRRSTRMKVGCSGSGLARRPTMRCRFWGLRERAVEVSTS